MESGGRNAARKKLIVDSGGRKKMCCPRCETVFDILQFIRLAQAEGFEDETTPVYKCPRRLGGCGFLFAPAEPAYAAYVA